jgi:hypothetical protein
LPYLAASSSPCREPWEVKLQRERRIVVPFIKLLGSS